MFSPLDSSLPYDSPKAVIFGLSGLTLTKEEKAFFKEADPAGFILFKRNCESPAQVKKLTASLQKLLGRTVPILIDQEGGRVQRMGAPEWHTYPPAASYSATFLRDFAKGRNDLIENTNNMAKELVAAGIKVNCAPVLDVQYSETHDAIGDRAFSNDPEIVAALGAIMSETLVEHKIIPVMKHFPGQGRATLDSHESLPEISASLEDMKRSDYEPFREMLTKAFSAPMWGMVAHVVYDQIDNRAPASCSRKVIYDVIRREIGFQGLLLSDDVCMGALSVMGDVQYRAEKVVRAGCDLALHCNGKMDEMIAVAKRAPNMSSESMERYNKTIEWFEWNK